jgi:uncharacterized hydrophobic protein (TIGR00271 family)
MSDSTDAELPADLLEERTAREIARLMAAQGRFSLGERRRILGILLPPQSRGLVRRFGVMLALSVAVAVMGLTADSAAVVIGAMLIAPLMTPILTFAASVGLGLPRRAVQAGFLVLAGSVGSIAFAFVLARLLPDVTLGSELLGRTRPDVRDLIVAVAAGAAGAYATAREDISSALPGVAVAVALVPPLATTGVVLELGETQLAEGSLLLFVVNLTAIFASALVVFFLTGVIPTIRLCLRSPRLSMTVVAVVAAMIAIAVPLTVRSVAAARDARSRSDITAEVDRWRAGTDLEVDEIDVDGDVVTVAVVGSHPPPDAFVLARALVDEVGPDVEVVVRWAQQAQGVARADSPPQLGDDPVAAARIPVLGWLDAASIDGVAYELLELEVSDDGEVEVVVGGPLAPPPSATLADDVAEVLGGEVELTVRWVQQLAIAGDGETDQQMLARLVDTWAGSRPSVRILDVSVRGGVAVIDLATDGTPAGLDVLDRLARRDLGEAAGVDIRSVPLTSLTPAPRTAPTPVID